MQTPPAGRRLPRVLLVAGAIAGGLAIAAVVDVARSGGTGAWLARHRVPVPYVAAGQRFDLGERSLYLDCRGTGSPTIVLEAGSGADSSTWAAVHDQLAATTRTCAYDRAGRGRSDPRDVHSLRDAAIDLRLLLAAGGAEPPFVVIGHSLGGAYGRVFAATFRSDVAGLVLVDAFGPDLEEAWLHPLLGSLRVEYAARLDGLRAHVATVDRLDWTTSEDQLRTADLAGLPIEVLVAPRGEPRLDGPANEAIAAARESSAQSLSPGHVTYTIAWGAGHEIQSDRPDLVIAAARRLVVLAR
jgi:pimeloyl-ACP methyl ester carboxylesterase